MIFSGVMGWWALLAAVGAVNIVAWSISAAVLKRRRAIMSTNVYTARRLQLLLSAVYVFGCAFRSALPVYDIPRICLFNTWLSSVLVGRLVATCAELCFVTQWALVLRETARVTGSVFAKLVSMTIVPLIAVAEVCSWYSVLTTSNLGHVFEETIWGLSAALLITGMIAVRSRSAPTRRPLLTACCAAGVLYVAYMFLADVPRYWSRWTHDESTGRQYLSVAQGVLDTYEHRVVSYRWNDWRGEMTWMSLYFSIAVWLSICLIHAPEPRGRGHVPGTRASPAYSDNDSSFSAR